MTAQPITPSTALTRFEPPAPPVVVRGDPLADAVRVFETSLDLARTLHKSGFLPKTIRSPEQALAIILTGREMGIGPMQSIRSISIVDARPVVAADLQLSRFKAEGGRAVFTELSDKTAVLQLRHPNGDEHTESFSLADAQKAGLAGKDNWKRYPKAMLRSRVITAGLKSVGFEPMSGVYGPDEAEEFAPKPARTPQRATASVVPEPESDLYGDPPSAEDDGPPPPTRDYAWADAYPSPFNRDTANYGKPFGEMSTAHLTQLKNWIVERMTEKGDDMFHEEPLAAITLVLAERAKVETTPA